MKKLIFLTSIVFLFSIQTVAKPKKEVPTEQVKEAIKQREKQLEDLAKADLSCASDYDCEYLESTLGGCGAYKNGVLTSKKSANYKIVRNLVNELWAIKTMYFTYTCEKGSISANCQNKVCVKGSKAPEKNPVQGKSIKSKTR